MTLKSQQAAPAFRTRSSMTSIPERWRTSVQNWVAASVICTVQLYNGLASVGACRRETLIMATLTPLTQLFITPGCFIIHLSSSFSQTPKILQPNIQIQMSPKPSTIYSDLNVFKVNLFQGGWKRHPRGSVGLLACLYASLQSVLTRIDQVLASIFSHNYFLT